MATAPVVNQGKGKFLRAFLASNRDAKVEDASAAWKAEGHGDGVSESLVSKIRSELGLVKKRGSNGVATEDARSGKAHSSPKGSKGKGKKLEKSPLVPDAQEDVKGQSKSAFVGEVLMRTPEANMKAINEAWAAAGHEGTISDSIFYKVKRERDMTGGNAVGVTSEEATKSGLSSKGDKALTTVSKSKPSPNFSKPRKAGSPVKAAPLHSNGDAVAPKLTSTMSNQAGGHGRELHEIEGEIDELMFRLKGLGSFAEVQEALRAARRLLVRSHQH